MGNIIRSLLFLALSIVLFIGFFFMASFALVIGGIIALTMGCIWLWVTRGGISDIETLDARKRPKWWTNHYNQAHRQQHQDDIDGGRTPKVPTIEGEYRVVE